MRIASATGGPRTVLFALPILEGMARALAEQTSIPRGDASVERFANGELHATLLSPAAGEDCILLGTITPPDEHLLSTLLLSHTLKKEGARSVTALVPYLGYARHDKEEARRSLGAAWVGELFRASGIDSVITIDVHSTRIHQLFPLRVESLSAAGVFAGEVGRLSLTDATVVAPDEGAIERCESVRAAAGMTRGVACFRKTRTPDSVSHSAMQGETGARAIVIDDILDTGGTLVSCCEALQRAGARDITIMVTHGLFTGAGWERLWSLGVTRIFCTDTVPLPAGLGTGRIVVLSVAPLLGEHVKILASRPRGHPPPEA